MTIFWPTPGFKGSSFELWVLNKWVSYFCVPQYPTAEMCERPPAIQASRTEVRLSFCNYTVHPSPAALERVDIKVCRRSRKQSAIGNGQARERSVPWSSLYPPSSICCLLLAEIKEVPPREGGGVGEEVARWTGHSVIGSVSVQCTLYRAVSSCAGCAAERQTFVYFYLQRGFSSQKICVLKGEKITERRVKERKKKKERKKENENRFVSHDLFRVLWRICDIQSEIN